MKVLALVTEAYGGTGGIAQYNRDFLAALAKSPQQPSIEVLPRVAAHAVGEPPSGVRQRRPRRGRVAYALGAAAFALRMRPDIVFCGHLFVASVAKVIARVTGARLVIQLHGIEIWRRPTPRRREALEDADLVLCVSRDTRARLLGFANAPPERAVVLSNTVGAAYEPGDRQAARRRLGLGSERVLLSVSRLDKRERYKGHDQVIAAVPALVARGLDVIYLVAGEGDDRPRLELLAKELGVAERVRFLGYAPDADLPALYRAADVFVLPSSGEGFGIVFLEAMACGTPAVGLAVGGAGDALCPGELGVAVDDDGLVEGLAKALMEPRPEGLSAKVAERFGAKAFASRVAALTGRLMEAA